MLYYMKYDITIIGGGIAGLYAAYKLCKYYPHKRIVVIEKQTLGGNIQTRYKHLSNQSKKQAKDESTYRQKLETGGAVLYEHQHNMHKLVKDLRIELIERDVVRDEKAYGHMKKVFEYIDTKVPHKEQVSKTLYELSGEVLSCEEVGYMITQYGYMSEFYATNAYNGKSNLTKEWMETSKIYFFKHGYTSVINSLLSYLQRNAQNVTIMTNTKVTEFKQTANQYLVFYETPEKRTSSIQTNLLIHALPQTALLKVKGFRGEEIERLSLSVQANHLCRIFVQFDVTKSDWLKTIPFTNMNNPIQKLIPLNPSQGVYQISYSDYQYAQFWNTLTNDEIVETVKKYMGLYFPEKRSQIKKAKVLWVKKYYWRAGTHLWKIGVDPKKESKKIRNIRKDMYIVGEAYSEEQGWSEGALQSVNEAYRRILKN